MMNEKIVEKPKTPQMTPANVRKMIGQLEFMQMNVQLEMNREQNLLKRNQMINVLDQITERTRMLYFMLKQLQEQGVVNQERQQKLVDDWKENQCPKCKQAKIGDDGKCLNPNCDFKVVFMKMDNEEKKDGA